jgi:hypothetical protein
MDRETNVVNFFETTLTGDVAADGVAFNVATTVGGPAPPCILVVDPSNETGKREVVLMTGWTGTQYSTILANRFLSGSAAAGGLTHSAGTVVRCVPLAQHIEDLNDRINVAIADAAAAVAAEEAARTAHEADTTVHGVDTALLATDAEVAGAVAAHAGALNPHPDYLTQAEAALLFDPLDADSGWITGFPDEDPAFAIDYGPDSANWGISGAVRKIGNRVFYSLVLSAVNNLGPGNIGNESAYEFHVGFRPSRIQAFNIVTSDGASLWTGQISAAGMIIIEAIALAPANFRSARLSGSFLTD